VNSYYISEIFKSIQGEGHYTGAPTIWVRSFGCNLECNGFGQDNPTEPKTWELPYKSLDISSITKLEDLPVFSKGCDSSYSWSKKYRHLTEKLTGKETAQRIESLLPLGCFGCSRAKTEFHLAFTGGEPLLKRSQSLIVDTLNSLQQHPLFVTFETNGTRLIDPVLQNHIRRTKQVLGCEYFFSVSPKLLSVSGEYNAIKPKILKQYREISSAGQLKFVGNGTPESWEEMLDACETLDPKGIYSRWVMPVGARAEEQHMNAGAIAEQGIDLGFSISARVHCYLWGNKIGT